MRSVVRRACLLFAVLLSGSAGAEEVRGRLPLDAFRVSQGLPSDSITSIFSDSRGFLWFGTLDGVSRFDGERFLNYGTDDGLPARMVWSVREDGRGAMLFGSDRGLARLSPSATRPRLFTRLLLDGSGEVEATALLVTRGGVAFASCGADLCTIENDRLRRVESLRTAGGIGVRGLAESPSGQLWAATDRGLFRRTRTGQWQHLAVQPGDGVDPVSAVLFDREGRLLIANGYGLFILLPAEEIDPRPLVQRAGTPLIPGMPLRQPQRPGDVVRITVPTPNPVILFRTPVLARDGTIWQPSYVGLLRIGPDGIDLYDGRDGLPLDITAVAEDDAGNVWIGSRGSGAYRLARNGLYSGLRTFTREHGLANERIMSLVELPDGSVCATNRIGLSCFKGTSVRHASLWPANTSYRGWGWNQIVLHDPDGSWWFAGGEGIVRWPRVARLESLGRIPPLAVLTRKDGLDHNEIFRLWRDSRGTLWAGTFGSRPLSRLQAGERRFESFGPAEGFPAAAPTAFAEDRAGGIWIGLYTGGAVRFAEGRFEKIAALPEGFVRDLRIDSHGALWVASTDGVARIADPASPAGRRRIEPFFRADGLAADSGYAVVELPDGRMAIGSHRGLTILDPRTRRSIHLTVRDGLPGNEISTMLLDRRGALWLGTINGLTRIDRIPAHATSPPPVPRIQSISIDGRSGTVAELGLREVTGVRLEWPQKRMSIAFGAPHFDNGAPLRFEYRIDDGSWSEAGAQRLIALEHPAGGSGRVEVRSVSVTGRASAAASVVFEVVPPFWRQAWFLACFALALAALAYAFHRSRLRHVVEAERLRTRVATDLHDDLGSSLSRISILSDAARQKNAAQAAPLLDEIAQSARGLVDALGDTIWSIDPQRDDARSLLLRVRRFASGIVESQGIVLQMEVPADAGSIRLDPDQRRQTFLIVKEALNNAARHAGAKNIAVATHIDARAVTIEIRDDGKGMGESEMPAGDGGRGLASMRERARRLGARLEIRPGASGGTTVTVALPR